MKKYLLFLPLALQFYVYFALIIGGNAICQHFNIPDYVLDNILIGYTVLCIITYLIGLWKICKHKDYNDHTTAKTAMLVKLPQILPNSLIGLYSLIIMIAPMGIFISVFMWLYMAIVYVAASIVTAIASGKLYHAGKISLALALTLGFFSFVPIWDLIIPIILFFKSKPPKKNFTSGIDPDAEACHTPEVHA